MYCGILLLLPLCPIAVVIVIVVGDSIGANPTPAFAVGAIVVSVTVENGFDNEDVNSDLDNVADVDAFTDISF